MARTNTSLPIQETPAAVGGELIGKQAALDAKKLTDRIVELKHVVAQPETQEAIQTADPAFFADFDRLVENWREFMSRLAGTDIPSWSKLGQLAQGFWLMFDRKEIYAAVQGYRAKFAAIVNRYSKAIGGEPLDVAEMGRDSMPVGRGTLMLPGPHVGASDAVSQRAEAALQRLVAFRDAWPTPSAGQGVRADAVLRVLKHVFPFAEMVAKLPVGHEKLGYPGAGHLTGDTITDDDRVIANYLKEEIADHLERAEGDKRPVLDAQRYNRIKESAHRLLMIATDLDVNEDVLAKTVTTATKEWGKLAPLSMVQEVGEMEAKEDPKADRDLAYLTRWTNGFPKPGPTQGVRADKLLGALKQLVPLATKIAKMKDGAAKGGYSGAGYLTGPVITQDDKVVSNRILYEVNERLPWIGTKAVPRDLLEQIRATSQRLLMIACDLDLDETLLDKASRAWESQTEAIMEAPELLYRAATEPWIPRLLWNKAKEEAGIGLAEVAVYGGLALGAGYLALKVFGK
jgi:hypothetical protein